MKYLNKLTKTGFFHIFGSSSINKVAAFASGLIIVWVTSKQDYGVFSYANNILSFFLLASGLGAQFGVLQMCSEKKDAELRKSIYHYGCRISALSNLLLAVVILIVAFLIPLKIEGSNFCLALMSFLPLAMLVYEMQCMYLRTELRNKEFAVANTAATLLIYIFSCVLAYFFGVNGLIAGKYMASVIAFVFIALKYKVSYPVSNVSIAEDDKKAFWRISLISMLNNGMSRLMYIIDIFVLGIVIPSSTAVASYRVATNIPTALSFIPAAVITYIYPYFAKNKDNKKWVLNRYYKLTAAFGVGSALISLVMFLFAPFLIKHLFGADYLDSVPAFRVLSISFAFSCTFRTLPGTLLVTQRKLTFNFIVALISSMINTALNAVMISAYGAVGAAYATLITVLLTGAANVVYLIAVLKKKSVVTDMSK